MDTRVLINNTISFIEGISNSRPADQMWPAKPSHLAHRDLFIYGKYNRKIQVGYMESVSCRVPLTWSLRFYRMKVNNLLTVIIFHFLVQLVFPKLMTYNHWILSGWIHRPLKIRQFFLLGPRAEKVWRPLFWRMMEDDERKIFLGTMAMFSYR